jgi:hypothetical protein
MRKSTQTKAAPTGFARSLQVSKCPCCGGPLKHVEFDAESLSQEEFDEFADGYGCDQCDVIVSSAPGIGTVLVTGEYARTTLHGTAPQQESTPNIFGKTISLN